MKTLAVPQAKLTLLSLMIDEPGHIPAKERREGIEATDVFSRIRAAFPREAWAKLERGDTSPLTNQSMLRQVAETLGMNAGNVLKMLRRTLGTMKSQVGGAMGQTFTREGPKVGRNGPCPCGSGKKHKQCCLKK